MSKKIILFILAVLLFLNATSLNISKSVGTFNMISYAIRVFIYFFVVYNVVSIYYPIALRKTYYFKFNIYVSVYLIFNILLTYLWTNKNTAISVPFPTLFALADNLLFLYLGYLLPANIKENEKFKKILWWFAVISIIVMTVLSIRIRLTYGSLVELWGMVRRSEGDSLGVMLNAYKNSFPYKFAILIPFLFIRKNKYNIYFSILCVINIIIVGKKGPLAALAIVGLLVFLISRRNKRRYLMYGGYALLIFFFYYLFIDDTILKTLEYRLDPSMHYNSDDTTSFYLSGRDGIWQKSLEGFYGSSILEQLFGHGTIGVIQWLVPRGFPGNAHNTWIEILYNYGIVGVLAYLAYYSFLIKMYFKMKRDRYEYIEVYLFLIIFSLTISMFTVSLYGGFSSMGYRGILTSYLLGHFIYKHQCSHSYNYNQEMLK